MTLASMPYPPRPLLLVCTTLALMAAVEKTHALNPNRPFHPDEIATKDLDRIVVRESRVSAENKYDPLTQLPHVGGLRMPGRMPAARRSATAKEQETDNRSDDCGQSAGNPVVLYTGNKVENELDFSSEGEMGLYLQRTYNHHWVAAGLFGHHWISNLDYSLAFSAGTSVAWLQRPDGRRIKLLLQPGTAEWREDRADARTVLRRNGDGSYTFHNEDRGTETYNADGYVLRRENEQGVAWVFEYQDKLLRKVTHTSGRSISLHWQDNRLVQVTDPAGSIYRYEYTANALGNRRHRLAATTLPGAPETRIGYHYEDSRHPGGLTGKSFNGSRYSTFAYDAQGRATSTEHAGGVERHTFQYEVERSETVAAPPAPPRPGGTKGDTENGWCEYRPGWGSICFEPSRVLDGPIPAARTADGREVTGRNAGRTRAVTMRVTHTNPLGRVTSQTYEDGRQISVTGQASPNCPASYKERTYDAYQHPDLVHDFANNLTDFDYNAKGQLLRTAEAPGTPAERVTTYGWDEGTHRLLRTTVNNVAETTHGYDDRGRVASTQVRNLSAFGIPNQTLTTHYRYGDHASGITASMTVDGPLASDDITYTYSAQGDLVRIQNALGHATTFAAHNGRGQPGRITTANGEVTERHYDARGRITLQRTNGGQGWATTTYRYDGAGNLVGVTDPAGVAHGFDYDQARRRTAEVRPMGDGTHAWTVHSYDADSNRTRTEVRHTDYPHDTVIAGLAERTGYAGQWEWSIQGWACSTGSKSPVRVYAYTEDGSMIGGAMADQSSEAGVGAACGSGGSAHRYQVPISLAQRQQWGGRRIAVHAASPRGGAHDRVLPNATDLRVPPADVTGALHGITRDANWNYFIEGWACSIGVAAPIDVHLFLGAPAGQGVHAAHVTANLPANREIAEACQSSSINHWFRIPLDKNARFAHGGKALHVHGVAVAPNQTDPGLTRSGTLTLPALERNASIVGFSPGPDWILNGEKSTLTLQLLNNGNTQWDHRTFLRWGPRNLNSHRELPHRVNPGEVVTLQWVVAPTHHQPATGKYFYNAKLTDDWGDFGPQAQTHITVENQHGYCPPVGPCHEPIRSEAAAETSPTEGES